MLIAALALAIQSSAITIEPEPEPIVVLGRRLRDWRGTVQTGRPCRTRRSSGDAELDSMACATLERCVAQAQALTDVILAAHREASRRERRRLLAPVNAGMTPCMQTGYESGLAAIADRRAELETE